MPAIELNKVIKRFGKVQTIHGVDLQIEEGEFVVFVGPSGCGKSTLLRLIAGLEDISDGEISIEDQVVNHVDPADRGVAMVFQSYALYPHMTVEENMGFGLKMSGLSKEDVKQQVFAAAQSLQLDPLLNRKPKELSGGQRQRVAIGRAIVRKPKVFLFDEPLSNLDAELRVEMRIQIAKLHQQLKNTMVYVTHDQVEAMTLADKIVVLKDGEISQVGTPLELYRRPQNEFVAGFIGSPKMNFLNMTVQKSDLKSIELKSEDGRSLLLENDFSTQPSLGQKLRVGIRPEHIQLDDNAPLKLGFSCDVTERLGNSTYLFGSVGGETGFKVHLNGDTAVANQEQLEVSFNSEDCHLFNDKGESLR
ncbi:sn-glycerol-3-phosphate ABC transporter ATP-binding protein UgpC [Alginatibacterium sediminis]|uniref:sn-glycerol-3-phosphate ABC transporter ATP-binding protein UgpC n=1 Tax=Alginatibacterium sediminis TaxID=2164068 RepID=A0A420EB56_9ALTE|nr:sn-glycerol-3-phosphate ABC transporter ATP-binding protein UgpC [Alginatibacterium sediminis]RKF17911.1 sn-glycerol-3-phosphate ABC transporter ATP-binding protein UgpC [Alginatibacterium sediminis]